MSSNSGFVSIKPVSLYQSVRSFIVYQLNTAFICDIQTKQNWQTILAGIYTNSSNCEKLCRSESPEAIKVKPIGRGSA